MFDLILGFIWLGAAATSILAPQLAPFFMVAMVVMLLIIFFRRARN